MLIGAPFSLTVLPLLANNVVPGSVPVSSATAPSVIIPMPDVLIQSVAVVNASSSIVYLGTEDGQVIEYDIEEDDEVRTWDLTPVLSAQSMLEGLAFVPSNANSDGGTFWMSDARALYEVRAQSTTTPGPLHHTTTPLLPWTTTVTPPRSSWDCLVLHQVPA